MKKLLCFVFVVLMLASSFVLCPQASEVAAQDQAKVSMRVYGDSITAGYGLEGYDGTNPSFLPQKSFPKVIYDNFSQSVNSEIKNYAISGDTSSDLVEILEPYTNGTATDMADFVSTDHFVICIGANNILGPAMSQMINYMISSVSNSFIKQALSTYVSSYEEITE